MHAYMRNSILNRAESNCFAEKKMYSVFLLLPLFLLLYVTMDGLEPCRRMSKFKAFSDEILYVRLNSNGESGFFPDENDYFCAVWERHKHSSPHLNNSHFIASNRTKIIK